MRYFCTAVRTDPAGVREVILQTDSTGGILIESEVDIKSEDNKKGSEERTRPVTGSL